MEISFDPLKRDATLQERGLDFADAGTVFEGPTFTFEDTRFVYAERRFSTFGLLNGRMVVLIWSETEDGRRIISMRKANDREQARYRHRMG